MSSHELLLCYTGYRNLELLQEQGIELVFFSPMIDALPERLHALYFGGGYPELHAAALAANLPLLAAVRAFALAGGVVYGECGGLMYLGKSIQCTEQETFTVCGVFDFRTRMVRDTKMGYVEVATNSTCRLFPPNQRARGQVYHFFQVRPVLFFTPALSHGPRSPQL
jgi:cobyrinic acid a,c-diamide synthase